MAERIRGIVLLTSVCALFCVLIQPARAGSGTTTTLAITSAGGAVTTVASGTAVTLTATVVAGGTPVTTGLVNFCDASSPYCTDIHLLATAQLTSTGTATWKFIPGIGSHSYEAIFVGTNAETGSSSSTSMLTVPGAQPTSTTLTQSGTAGNYTLIASVSGSGVLSPPSGSVSFLDTSNSNAVLGNATVGADMPALNWVSSVITPGNLGGQILEADLNGDGKLDLVAQSGMSRVAVDFGNGDGTFRTGPTSSLSTSNGTTFAATADFNGDGKVDVAFGLDFGGVAVLLGNGDGTFTPAPGSPNSLINSAGQNNFQGIGDFNGDGKPDLAVENSVVATGNPNPVTIFFGNGDGTFTAGPTTTGVSGSIAGISDLNGDGKLDLVLSTPGNTGAMTVLLGNGDGTFTQSASIPDGPFGAAFLAIADFNGDGKGDLAIGNVDSNTVVVWLGNGDGTFTEAPGAPIPVGYPEYLIPCDFNGDGKADLIAGGLDQNATLTALLGNGDGTFTSTTAIPQVGDEVQALVVGNLNGDGLPDLLATTDLGGEIQVVLTQLMHTVTATATGISPFGTGTHLVDAGYGGDSSYAASTSTTVALTTVPPPAPDFAIAGTPATATVVPGASATYTFTITPSNGFNSAVTLSCGTLPQETNCTFSPASVTPAGTPIQSTLTVTTTAATNAFLLLPQRPSSINGMTGSGPSTFFAAIVLLFVPRRFRRKQFWIVPAVALFMLAGMLSACGGSSNPVTSNPGTPAGTSTIAVTATAGSGSAATSHAASVTLVVQ